MMKRRGGIFILDKTPYRYFEFNEKQYRVINMKSGIEFFAAKADVKFAATCWKAKLACITVLILAAGYLVIRMV